MKYKNLLIIPILLIALGEHSFAASNRSLCAASDGSLLVRKKCKAGESKLSLSALASAGLVSTANSGTIGPIGPDGVIGPDGIPGTAGTVTGARGKIDFSACHIVTTQSGTIQDYTTAVTSCDSINEFIFDVGYSVAAYDDLGGAGTRAYFQIKDDTYAKGSNNETLPYRTDITATAAISAGSGAFLITVKALCCPR